MFMNEENGLRGGTQYAENAIKNNEKHIVAIESDASAYIPGVLGFLVQTNSWKKYKTG